MVYRFEVLFIDTTVLHKFITVFTQTLVKFSFSCCAGMWFMAVIQLKVLRERFLCGSSITSCSAGKSAMSTGSMPETHHITRTQSYIQLHLLLTEKTWNPVIGQAILNVLVLLLLSLQMFNLHRYSLHYLSLVSHAL